MADSKVIRLREVRLSFPRLFTPKAFKQGQDPRYEATFLLDPTKPKHAESIKEIKAEALKVCIGRYGSKEKIPKLIKCYGVPVLDEDTGKPDKDYEGYEGMFYIACSNKKRITVVDRDGRTPLVEADGKPYGGCIVEGTLTLWVYDNPAAPEHGKRLLANLRAVRYLGKGQAFGVQPVDAEEEFEALEDGTESGEDEDDIPF